jgi:phenylalanyl-tRNA synthetase alpha chain
MSDPTDILSQLDQIQEQGLVQLQAVQDETDLQAWKTAHLGRSAPVMQVFSQLPQLPREQRPQVGQRANQVKQALEAAFEARNQAVQQEVLAQALKTESLDVTLPGRRVTPGRLHLETRTLRQIYHIFGEMGFQVYRTPEVETDDYNFTLLNMPEYHPARDLFDTFYTTTPGVLLRTHTSPGQIWAMREYAPEPVRVILPGMCYRYEQVTVRSDIQFYQVEVLAVGHNITFGDLKGTLSEFARRVYGADVRMRFRPSYFPFTEPSAELDIECFICKGTGCPVCKQSGWLEILGSGMIHPVVLQNGGYDPAEFTGFAAGMGSGRIGMLRHSINDIRNLWINDMRFLEQF